MAVRECSAQTYVQSVIKAIEAKYLEDDTEDYQKTEGISIMYNQLTAIKAGGITLPQCLALNYCHISKAGDAGRLHELCRHVKELDLAENDLTDWNEVLNLVSQIPNLRFLNLSSNPLDSKIDLHPKHSTQVASLKALALNNTKVPWDTLYHLLDTMPGLEELHLSLNDYRKIPPTPNNKTYPQLTLLQFNENHISQWEELCPLGRALPQLTTLILIGNKLSGQITSEISANFPKLSCLNLTNTSMQSWEELESLNNFPVLINVRLQGIPFCEHIPDEERRQLCLARLGNVSRFNGSSVHDLEREDAERAFIRYYMDTATKPARYQELLDKHGNLDKLAKVDLRPPDSIKCKVHFENQTKELYINVKQTCKEFKSSMKELTGVPGSKIRLSYQKHYGGEPDLEECHVEKLPYPNKLLYSLNVHDGDEFFLDKKYDALVKKYGHLDRLVEIDLRPQNTFQCTVHFEEKSELMYITVTQTIRDFKKSLFNFTQLPSTKLRLFYGDMDVNLPYFAWEEIKWHNRMMHYLQIKDGDSFMVMEK